MGLAHCKAVSHMNYTVSGNLPHVKGFRSLHHWCLSIKVQKRESIGFGVLKIKLSELIAIVSQV